MATVKPHDEQPAATHSADGLVPDRDVGIEVTSKEFRAQFGEDLHQALDLDTWRSGRDLSQEYTRIESEVREAIREESRVQRRIREEVLPRLAFRPEAPKNAGTHRAAVGTIARIHRGLLFNGGVEACDGTQHVHDTLPLTIYQIGVSLVSYRGDQGTWCQRLFRRDLRQCAGDPVEDIVSVLERRTRRSALNHASPDDAPGQLVQNTIMQYAERLILLRRSTATWRMGHGNPITYELLTGAGNLELMVVATTLLRDIVERHQKFVFVASEPRDRMLLTIGQALRPMEYAIVETLKDWLGGWLHQERFKVDNSVMLDWDGEAIAPYKWIRRFIDRVASQIVVGLYRATRYAPAQLFYAHVDHADLAAHIVLADSVLQEHRGFPLLIDLADHVCRSVFGGTLQRLTETAYAAAGEPWRYFSERTTRAR
jgi:hypothetical protein